MGDLAEDGLFVTYAGTEVGVGCVANQCQTRVVARSCGITNPVTCADGQVCVSYESVIGPTSSVDYACQANPCAGTLDCACAQSTCDLRSDSQRICWLPNATGATTIVDIGCQDTRQ